jgi:hypothetical protein
VNFKRTQLAFSEHGRWVSVEERVKGLPPAMEISSSARFSIPLQKCNGCGDVQAAEFGLAQVLWQASTASRRRQSRPCAVRKRPI